jgi:hypothetical protein
MSVKPVHCLVEGYDCGCDCCNGEACSSCPYCIARIYEYDHPGMETFGLGSFPPLVEPFSQATVEREVCPRCKAGSGEPCRRPNGE